MKFKQNIKTLLASILLLTFIWIIFLLTQFILKAPTNKNENFIPSTANFALKIDAKEIVDKTIYSLLFEGRDEKIIKQIEEILKQPSTNKKELGINFLSDIILFSNPFENGQIIGVSLNLSNPSDFKNNIPEMLDKNQVVSVIDNVGIILTYIPTSKDSKTNKDDLLKFFDKNIKTREKVTTSAFNFERKKGVFLQTQLKEKTQKKSAISPLSKINFELINNGLDIDGTIEIDANSPVYFLQPKNESFCFSSGFIPKSIQDSLFILTKKTNLNTPEIQSISLNYSGVNIINDDSGMNLLPAFELLLAFKEDYSINDILQNEAFLSKIGGKYSNNKLFISDKEYYTKQINKSTIYIGDTKNPSIIENPNKKIISIEGKLSSILKIEGGGMITSFLEIIPAFKASKELFNNIDKVEINITKNKLKNSNLKGSVKFKKDHYLVNEMVKFLLDIQFILM